jgi:hypothetical protein
MFSSTDAANVPVKKYGMKVRAFCGVEEGERGSRRWGRWEGGREEESKAVSGGRKSREGARKGNRSDMEMKIMKMWKTRTWW